MHADGIQLILNTPLPLLIWMQAAIAASAGGASSSSGAAGIRGMVQQMIEEARRLPPIPPMPVDYSGLLASVHRWIEELQGAAGDVEQAQAVGAMLVAEPAEPAVLRWMLRLLRLLCCCWSCADGWRGVGDVLSAALPPAMRSRTACKTACTTARTMLPAPVQEASREQADVAARLAAAALPGDPAGWHRLTWLGQVLPLLAFRLGEVAGKAAPGTEAVQALQQLALRIESEQVRQGRARFEHRLPTVQAIAGFCPH